MFSISVASSDWSHVVLCSGMTVDYQVLLPQELIRLNALRRVFSADVPTIEIIGQDFSAVDQVLINDQPSPFIEILSKTKLTAQVPSSIPLAEVSSVNVVSRRLMMTASSVLRFQVSETPAKCTGIMKLMQLYVKLMLTTPGTDIMDPHLGGGILSILGSNIASKDGQAIINKFYIANDSVVRQIIAIQGRQPRLPLDEKLLSANVVSCKYSAGQGALLVSVELTSQAGRSALANLVM